MDKPQRHRAPMQRVRDLAVPQRAQLLMRDGHKLVVEVPDHEKRGLSDQMRRASKSVGGLIAEGWGLRSSAKEFKNYLRRALGSANEMEAHLDTARVLEYRAADVGDRLIQEYRELGGQLVRVAAAYKTYERPSPIVHPLSSPPSDRRASER